MTKEQIRLEEDASQKEKWKKWGPYLSERQWGTVREDYSENGEPWESTTHSMARSKTYRWGEEGIGGFCDDKQLLCFSLALWNKKDPILKERMFGLSGLEGNHGEDVKEQYFFIDATPTHSYMKMLYKYPQQEFPYEWLLSENAKRSRLEPEFELMDTGIFNEDAYFDVFIEYAKNAPDDLLIQITIINRSQKDATVNVIPQLWFRNTWAWGYDDYKPMLSAGKNGKILIEHKKLGELVLHFDQNPELLFCDNETNTEKLYGVKSPSPFVKDGINNYVVNGNSEAVNPAQTGTKAALNYDLTIKAGASSAICLRLEFSGMENPFAKCDAVFKDRKEEADEFYKFLQQNIPSKEEALVQRQALAGMLWSKQFYYYDVDQWLQGDPAQLPPPEERKSGRNSDWKHLNNADIISMPDTWEYPWYASWDLAFHCITLALVDRHLAKSQLHLFVREWFMHPNGQLPAYEWDFGSANPPVHAYASWRVYEIDRKINDGIGDVPFLESVFHKLLINFTWWVNRKDSEGNNLFEGGFLGLDNISVFDRDLKFPGGTTLEQSDGTSWMAMYALNMMRISLELAKTNPVYQGMATKFFEHFLYIAGAMERMGPNGESLWDEADQFYYDLLKTKDQSNIRVKVRSIVGLIPLLAVEVLDNELLEMPEFNMRLKWFIEHRPQLADTVSYWNEKNTDGRHLLSLLRGHRMKMILKRLLDETEFLSPYGIRSLSKFHEENPYRIHLDGLEFEIKYTPAESDTGMYGGNSNWRGPVWMPINFMIIEALQRFHYYYGEDFKVEYPTGSGNLLSLNDISEELTKRLTKLFLPDQNGHRPSCDEGHNQQGDPNFNAYVQFHEYFHGDTGKGLGASHQTGWTALIAKLMQK